MMAHAARINHTTKKLAPKNIKEKAAISSTINATKAERSFPLKRKESQGAIMAINIITYKVVPTLQYSFRLGC
jgi:hypothetical protein